MVDIPPSSKRQIMGGLMDDNKVVAMDGTNADHVRLLVEDLHSTFEKHLELLKAELANSKNEQKQAYSSGILKLPKSIRQMSIKDFNEAYSCDVVTQCLLPNDSNVQRLAAATAAAMKKRDHKALETPAPVPRRNLHKTPSLLRTVRRGEAIYSENGSPVNANDHGSLVATVSKKRKGNSASFEINVGEGKYIDISNPDGVKDLDSEMKATAASQLKVLQDQMDRLMAQLST